MQVLGVQVSGPGFRVSGEQVRYQVSGIRCACSRCQVSSGATSKCQKLSLLRLKDIHREDLEDEDRSTHLSLSPNQVGSKTHFESMNQDESNLDCPSMSSQNLSEV